MGDKPFKEVSVDLSDSEIFFQAMGAEDNFGFFYLLSRIDPFLSAAVIEED